MAILVTGAAGFVGSRVSRRLLDRGEEVIGIDNINTYYDPALKEARLAPLLGEKGFTFVRGDIADTEAVLSAVRGRRVDRVVHLAAQAGVRYSLEAPRAYIRSNISGHLEILELCRAFEGFKHLVYASSSSVYGGNEKVPFSEADRVDTPVSLYAATKKADELMSHVYSHLFEIPQTGLRYFTVYGPFGRPDMAYWSFTKNIIEGKPIKVFNNGEMWRDFTYIDDIVTGTIAALDKPPASDGPLHRIYNIGNNRPEKLSRFIDILEELIGVAAVREMAPMQPGDVVRTYADTAAIERDFGFKPSTSLETGLRAFVGWYREYFKV
ncbi:MAG: NAD-dependent epimerase/dehydratase family protein [Parvibaculum sp.]|uniref:NAD-dependent epimerase/dehydratase family protein n=1 Tax=Parvibaculum sp. TaxID=2024848 RepID=UPI0025D2D8DD|nr:NAD-dependent epimerase/dehydratase family protein [Parvibaculum sp.]MCE9649120.1 NAD-dependent epimerase/dehydratase family protein [Parvibaculum sp.]